jgi:hypothetical protein
MAGLAETTNDAPETTDDAPDAPETPDTEAPAEDKGDDAESEQPATEEAEDIVYIGDAPPPDEDKEPAPAWVKELRKKTREDAKKIRELEAKIAAQTQQTPPPVVPALGPKPKMADVDYDPEQYEAKLTEWHERKRRADEAEAAEKAKREEATKSSREKLEAYSKAKAALRVPDFDEAEEVVIGAMSIMQQDLIVQYADAPHTLVYALGKNPTKAKELAAIKDPGRFIAAIVKLEPTVKVQSRKGRPESEIIPSGTGRVSGADNVLEKLRAEAEKTGDYTKVVDYKRKLEKQKKGK